MPQSLVPDSSMFLLWFSVVIWPRFLHSVDILTISRVEPRNCGVKATSSLGNLVALISLNWSLHAWYVILILEGNWFVMLIWLDVSCTFRWLLVLACHWVWPSSNMVFKGLCSCDSRTFSLVCFIWTFKGSLHWRSKYCVRLVFKNLIMTVKIFKHGLSLVKYFNVFDVTHVHSKITSRLFPFILDLSLLILKPCLVAKAVLVPSFLSFIKHLRVFLILFNRCFECVWPRSWICLYVFWYTVGHEIPACITHVVGTHSAEFLLMFGQFWVFVLLICTQVLVPFPCLIIEFV